MGSYACETTRTWSMQLKQFIAFKRKRPRVIDCNICIPLDRVLISFTDLKISEFLSLLIINSFVCFIKKRFIQVFKNATRFAWGCKFDSHRKAKELHWSQLGSEIVHTNKNPSHWFPSIVTSPHSSVVTMLFHQANITACVFIHCSRSVAYQSSILAAYGFAAYQVGHN